MLEENRQDNATSWENDEAFNLHKNVSHAAGDFIYGKVDLNDINRLKKIIRAQEKLIKATETFIININKILEK